MVRLQSDVMDLVAKNKFEEVTDGMKSHKAEQNFTLRLGIVASSVRILPQGPLDSALHLQ